jgi:glycosyltransferase involved in cell wall biosynthesis
MHLLFISTLANPLWGGSEVLWSDTAAKALSEGHQVSIFISDRTNLEQPLKSIAREGGKIYFWKDVNPPPSLLNRILNKMFCRRLCEWEWWHRNIPLNADVICLNQGGALCGPMRHGLTESIMASGKPYLVLARADTGFNFLTDRTRPHVRQFFEGAQAFVSASQSAIDLLRLSLPSKLSNAEVLHSPLADYGAALDSDTLALDSSGIVEMACVGRLRAGDKGQHLLLACLAEDLWCLRPYRLSFYGGGPDRKYLEELVGFYGLGDKVRFAGHTSDVAGIWKRSQLAVQPSFVEGAPQSLLEAMLCRRPCVATAVSGIPEWVEEGRTGFLAEAPTVHHLRLALERAWENRHRWAEMGEAAREACLAKRDPNPAGSLLGLLCEAAKQSR